MKYLAFFVPAVAIAPAAVAKLAAENPQVTGKWVCLYAAPTFLPDGIDGSSSFDEPEESLMLDKNTLFSGKLGIFDGVTIHRHN